MSSGPGPPAVQGGRSPRGSSRQGPPTEDILLTYVEQLADACAGYRAIHFHLSRLHRSHRADKHRHIAANILMQAVEQYSGRLFALRSGDIVIIGKDISGKAIDDTIDTLRYLFNDDPLSQPGAEARFCSIFDLESGFDAFHALVQQMCDAAAQPSDKAARRSPKQAEPRIDELLEAIGRIDLSQMVKRQSIWAIYPGQKPRPKFDELFVSIDRLRATIAPDVDFAKDPQAFQYLTRWLDRHMLTRLAWEQFGIVRPISININLSTLHSPEFLKFDNERASGWRGRTILEIQLGDMWSDLAAYLAIADQVKQRGYLRCLDGVTYQAFPCINFNRLKVDLVKMIWDDALLQLDEGALRTLYQAMTECGTRRIVFTRCGRAEALQFGRAMGVRLFQGWHLDNLNGRAALL